MDLLLLEVISKEMEEESECRRPSVPDPFKLSPVFMNPNHTALGPDHTHIKCLTKHAADVTRWTRQKLKKAAVSTSHMEVL